MADEAVTVVQEIMSRLDSLEARMKQVESFLGHIHVAEAQGERPLQEYPKQVGSEVVYSAAEEAKLKGASKTAPAAA